MENEDIFGKQEEGKVKETKVNQQISNALEKIRRIAENENKKVKQMTPHLLIRSDKRPELITFLHEYERLLMENHVLTEELYTKVSYLELTYPGSMELEGKFAMFFDSPGEVAHANFRNLFSGVFVISLDNYLDCCKNERITDLVQFAKEKQNTIRFVFLLPARAENFCDLEKTLQEYLALETLDIGLPSQQEVEHYFTILFAEQGLYITSGIKSEIQLFVKQVVDNDWYTGYASLEVIGKKIVSKYYAEGLNETNDTESIRNLLQYVNNKNRDDLTKRRIGFC